jgi:hypothetical protein
MKNNLFVFKKNKRKVIEALKNGTIDYVTDSKWSFSDEFFAFLLSSGFFSFAQRHLSQSQSKKKHSLLDTNWTYALS